MHVPTCSNEGARQVGFGFMVGISHLRSTVHLACSIGHPTALLLDTLIVDSTITAVVESLPALQRLE